MSRSTTTARGLIPVLILAVVSSARAADETAVERRAADLLEEIASHPTRSGIPAESLRDAVGIVIVPRIVENRLAVGRKKGHGVFLSREPGGAWGDPEPVEVSGTSVGAEAGRELSDLVIIYRTREAANKYGEVEASFAFGLGATWALRPSRRFYRHSSDRKSMKDVEVYTRRHGLLIGAGLTTERRWGPRFEDEEPSPSPKADPKATGGRSVATARGDAPSPGAKAPRAPDSPETARLRAILTAMSTRPPDPVAGARTKDATVRPASGTMPPAPSAGAGPRPDPGGSRDSQPRATQATPASAPQPVPNP